MRSLATWFRQSTCPHATRSWETEAVTETMTRTTGGCVRCGKWIAPGCERCGR